MLRFNGTHPSRPRRHCRGLSLVEVLIALSISALLLVATGTAFDAAFTSYKSNQDMANVSVAARNALHQMVSTIRSAYNADPDDDPDYAIYIIDEADEYLQCAFVDALDRDIIYRYNDDTNQIQMNIDGGADWYVLVDDVYPVEVDDPVFEAIYTGDNRVANVEIRFQVAQEGLTRTISAGAVPRNIIYEN